LLRAFQEIIWAMGLYERLLPTSAMIEAAEKLVDVAPEDSSTVKIFRFRFQEDVFFFVYRRMLLGLPIAPVANKALSLI
jgi:hypothetical protein